MQIRKGWDSSGWGKNDQTEIHCFSYRDLKEESFTPGMKKKKR